jgi:hypothetical protein
MMLSVLIVTNWSRSQRLCSCPIPSECRISWATEPMLPAHPLARLMVCPPPCRPAGELQRLACGTKRIQDPSLVRCLNDTPPTLPETWFIALRMVCCCVVVKPGAISNGTTPAVQR